MSLNLKTFVITEKVSHRQSVVKSLEDHLKAASSETNGIISVTDYEVVSLFGMDDQDKFFQSISSHLTSGVEFYVIAMITSYQQVYFLRVLQEKYGVNFTIRSFNPLMLTPEIIIEKIVDKKGLVTLDSEVFAKYFKSIPQNIEEVSDIYKFHIDLLTFSNAQDQIEGGKKIESFDTLFQSKAADSFIRELQLIRFFAGN